MRPIPKPARSRISSSAAGLQPLLEGPSRDPFRGRFRGVFPDSVSASPRSQTFIAPSLTRPSRDHPQGRLLFFSPRLKTRAVPSIVTEKKLLGPSGLAGTSVGLLRDFLRTDRDVPGTDRDVLWTDFGRGFPTSRPGLTFPNSLPHQPLAIVAPPSCPLSRHFFPAAGRESPAATAPWQLTTPVRVHPCSSMVPLRVSVPPW
jgi:hypothetical protein